MGVRDPQKQHLVVLLLPERALARQQLLHPLHRPPHAAVLVPARASPETPHSSLERRCLRSRHEWVRVPFDYSQLDDLTRGERERERHSNFKSKNAALQTKLRFITKQEGVVPNNNHLFILFFSLSEEKCSWWMFCAQTWLSNETLCTSARPSNGNSVQEQMGARVSSSRNKDLGNQTPLACILESVLLVFFLACNV